jgi:hypothetical protein
MGLGRNVGKLMKVRDLSYGDVARGIGIADPQSIFALVKRDSKKSQFAGRLAEYFGVSLHRLVADDLQIDETTLREPQAAAYDSKIKTSTSDGEKLLVLIRSFLDTDAEGRNQLLKAAVSVSQAHGATTAQTRRRARRR